MLSRILRLYAHSIVGRNAHDHQHSSDLCFISQSIHKLFCFSYICTGIGLLIWHCHVSLLHSSSDRRRRKTESNGDWLLRCPRLTQSCSAERMERTRLLTTIFRSYSQLSGELTTFRVYFEPYWVTALLLSTENVFWFKLSLLLRLQLFAFVVLVIFLE